jgi:hypothetical protein
VIICRAAVLDCQWRLKIEKELYGEVQLANMMLKGPLRPAFWTPRKGLQSGRDINFNNKFDHWELTGKASVFYLDAIEAEFLEEPTYREIPVRLRTVN